MVRLRRLRLVAANLRLPNGKEYCRGTDSEAQHQSSLVHTITAHGPVFGNSIHRGILEKLLPWRLECRSCRLDELLILVSVKFSLCCVALVGGHLGASTMVMIDCVLPELSRRLQVTHKGMVWVKSSLLTFHDRAKVELNPISSHTARLGHGS
jgi:hypothetical protein